MIKITHPLTLLSAMLVCALYTAPAYARARVFVASYGNDANPCTFGSPCKTFQHAHDVVDTGGEITAIDSAGFGSINIMKAVTITSPDGVEAGIVPNPPTADAIDINAAPSDAVVLRGLSLNGAGVGANGIVFNSGASLTIANCVVQNFLWDGSSQLTGNGILIAPTSGTINFAITNTTVANNGFAGVYYTTPSGSPTVTGVIDHAVATANQYGIGVGAAGTGATHISVSNSVASNNVSTGLITQTSSTSLTFSIDNVSVVGNGMAGIAALGTPNVLLGRSVITGNGTGVYNSTSPNNFYTYKDNRINENGTDIGGPAPTLNTAFALQ
jgi:hypothetical protein